MFDTATANAVFNTANHPAAQLKHATKLCDDYATHFVKMCDVQVTDFAGSNGARGRNRTTDTRIFNPLLPSFEPATL